MFKVYVIWMQNSQLLKIFCILSVMIDLIDCLKPNVNTSRVILCLQVRESNYVHIYIFYITDFFFEEFYLLTVRLKSKDFSHFKNGRYFELKWKVCWQWFGLLNTRNNLYTSKIHLLNTVTISQVTWTARLNYILRITICSASSK